MTKIIFPTDEHFPFQDDRARSVALQIARDFDPHIRIAGSDGIDFYAVSKYDKNPARVQYGLQKEIDAWKAGQREWLDAAPNAHAFFIVGNHEDRLRKYLWKHPELSDLEALKLPNLLDFYKLGIFWQNSMGENANQELVLHGKLVVKHGAVVRNQSAYSARAELEREFYTLSVLSGHTHRGGVHYATTRQGVVAGYEGFCLCSLEPEYVRSPNWQQGLVIAEVTPAGLSVEPIPFFREGGRVKAHWRGKQYVE